MNRRLGDRIVPLVVRGGIGREALGERVWAEIQASQGAGALPPLFGPGSVAATALLERRIVYVLDTEAAGDEFPETLRISRRIGFRTQASAPLLHGDRAIGTLVLYNMDEPRPFSEQQLALLEAFASQAVVAIENARLFEELEQRNADLQESNRQVTEALQQQTATSEILRV